MPAETVVRLTSWEQLQAAAGDDAFVRYDVGPAFAGGWAVDGAVAFVRPTPSRRLSLALLGGAPGVALLLSSLAADPEVLGGRRPTAVSLPVELEPLLHQHFRAMGGADWEWFWTTAAPSFVPGEQDLTVLDNCADAEELAAFLAEVSPSASARPGDAGNERWVGVRDDGGALVACGAMQRTVGGSPHLAGIAVRPDRRGEGLGAAVTAALTRRALALDGVCTLAMYSDNAVARSLYLRLGYRVGHAWATRVIQLLG